MREISRHSITGQEAGQGSAGLSQVGEGAEDQGRDLKAAAPGQAQ